MLVFYLSQTDRHIRWDLNPLFQKGAVKLCSTAEEQGPPIIPKEAWLGVSGALLPALLPHMQTSAVNWKQRAECGRWAHTWIYGICQNAITKNEAENIKWNWLMQFCCFEKRLQRAWVLSVWFLYCIWAFLIHVSLRPKQIPKILCSKSNVGVWIFNNRLCLLIKIKVNGATFPSILKDEALYPEPYLFFIPLSRFAVWGTSCTLILVLPVAK